MNKVKLLVISVVILLILNIVLISSVFFYNSKPFPPHRKRTPKEIIIKKLDFDESQIIEYEGLIKNHRKEIHFNDRGIRRLKQELYSSLKTGNYNLKDSLIIKINIMQEDIEHLHFDHFVDIKKICTENQLEKFNKLSEELLNLFSPHKPPSRHFLR